MTTSTYGQYLRGYVEALAKVTTPSKAADESEAAAMALAWRDVLVNKDPQSRAAIERAVGLLIA